MPWTVEDVDKHKGGLSPGQKRRWVKIANEVLDACETHNGKDCDVLAIKVANSKVGRKDG
jgi:hypothetical protein